MLNIREQTKTQKREGVGRVTPCCHPQFSFIIMPKKKKMTSKIY